MPACEGPRGATAPIEAALPAVSGPGCTQEDMPALVVRVAIGPDRQLWIEVAGIPGRSDMHGRYDLSPLRRDLERSRDRLARAWIETRGGRTREWLTGEVTLRSVRPREGATGDFEVRTSKNETLANSFDARWEETRSTCG